MGPCSKLCIFSLSKSIKITRVKVDKSEFLGRICLLSQKMSYTDVFMRSWSALH